MTESTETPLSLDELHDAMRADSPSEAWARLLALQDRWPAHDHPTHEALEIALYEQLERWREATLENPPAHPHGVWRLGALETSGAEFFTEDGDADFETLDTEARDVAEPGVTWYGPLNFFIEISPDGRWREVSWLRGPVPCDTITWFGELEEYGLGMHELSPEEWLELDESATEADLPTLQAPYAWPQYARTIEGKNRDRFHSPDDPLGFNTAEDGPLPSTPSGAHFLVHDQESSDDMALYDQLRWTPELLGRTIIMRWDGLYTDLTDMGFERIF